MSLPRFGGFKSTTNGKYLTYIAEDAEVAPNLLQYSSDELINSRNKYALEPAGNGEDGVMNIRCCYNNKYWRAESSSSLWIAAAASQPNENQSDWSCTLFKFAANTDGGYEITHLNRGEPVVLYGDTDHPNCLYIANSNTGRSHTIVDWEALVILPKYVVFQGDNGGYLQAHSQDGHEYLQFGNYSDPSAYAVGNEVFKVGDGNIRIKSIYWGKFWKSNPNWIWANSSDTSSNDKSTLFTPIKVSDNVVALKNLGGNQLFCRRHSIDYKENCLSAEEHTISKKCEVKISEYVSSRTIYNVKFRLTDSRIYGETIEVAATQDASNKTSGTITQGLNLSYVDEVSNTWSSTLELKLGFGLEFSAGIPFITSSKVTVAGQITGSYSWGQTLTTKTSKKSTYEAIVLPNTWVKVSLIATKGFCDVPFSYTQRDVYNDGTVKIEERDDGLYTGLNCYNYNYEVEEKKI